ncbi:hypothetical protein LTR95_006541 [Oleoguttula sp. CCFEE 5521]
MSQEARMERHLMRQRGAGPRAVKAEFGFAFPFANIVSAPGNDPLEPSAKRRKVVSNDGNIESAAVKEPDVARPATHLGSTASQPVDVSLAAKLPPAKRTRKRKLLDLDNATESVPPPPQYDIDDSFVTGLKAASRTTRAQNAAAHVPETEPVTLPAAKKTRAAPRKRTLGSDLAAPPSRSKSKGQAAVMPVEKVAMSLVEEVTPVDKLRRGVTRARPADNTARRKARNAEMLASPTVIPLLDPRITYTAKLTASLAAAEKLGARAGAHRKKPTARQALRETDANIVRVSLSPAKGDKALHSDGGSTSKECNESRTKSDSMQSSDGTPEQPHPQLATARHTTKGTAAIDNAALPLDSTAKSTKGQSVQGATDPSNTPATASKTMAKTKRRVATEDDLDLLFAA